MNENVAAGSVNKQLRALMFTMSALTRSRPLRPHFTKSMAGNLFYPLTCLLRNESGKTLTLSFTFSLLL